MSRSSEFAVRSSEKPRFSQTCSMLSQYLKEKGSFRDLSLAMTCNNDKGGSETARQVAATMNLFPASGEQSYASSFVNVEAPWNNGLVVDLFSRSADSCVNKPTLVEPHTAQMTIFYAGQVLVFDDFPADKAKEIMLLAGKRNSESDHIALPALPSNSTNINPPVSPDIGKTSVEPIRSVLRSPTLGFGNNVQENCQPPPKAVPCDLPIARRASLHRFLEKRKDRITARAPYQTSNLSPATAIPSKAMGDGKSWLSLAQ